MTLRYRGIEYNTSAQQVQFVEEVIGKYRGAKVTRRVAKGIHAPHIQGLVYRGASV